MARKLRMTHRAYFDHPAIGCGWRGVAVLKTGYKWVHLREISTGTNFKLSVEDWEDHRAIPVVRGKLVRPPT